MKNILWVLLFAVCTFVLALTGTPTLTTTFTSSLTPTPIPLSKIELEPILILPGDLPAGLSGAQVSDLIPKLFDNLPKADNNIYQQFEQSGRSIAGGVTVLLYENRSDLERAYALIVKKFGKPSDGPIYIVRIKTLTNVGEKATVLTLEETLEHRAERKVLGILKSFLSDNSDLVFVRCNAVVHIRMTTTSYVNHIVSYARRLDKRLKTLVCR